MLQKLRLMRTHVGRMRVQRELVTKTYPLLRPFAVRHRSLLGARTRIVAVTGSLGKTTATAAIAAVLGRPDSLYASNVQGMAALAVLGNWPWHRYRAIEVGIAKPGQMADFAALIRPDVVVQTAVAMDHARTLGTLEQIRDEKARLLDGLRPGGVAVLNGDDPMVRTMAARTGARIVTYGHEAGNDVRALDWRLDWPNGNVVTVAAGDEVLTIRSRLLGRAYTYPILAAVAVGRLEGIPTPRIVAALEAVPPQTCRLEPIRLPDGVTLIDDTYKGNAKTVHAALDLLAMVPARRVAVLGEVYFEIPAQRDEAYHAIGARLPAAADRVILFGKDVGTIRDSAVAAGMAPDAIVEVGLEVTAAMAEARRIVRPGDVVLLKGKQSQHLSRVGLALEGREVRCTIPACEVLGVHCRSCPMLGRGWQGLAVPTSQSAP
ncbi:MAG: Mur ligase family protein [Geminicoccaceae bacterium]